MLCVNNKYINSYNKIKLLYNACALMLSKVFSYFRFLSNAKIKKNKSI